MDYNSKVDDALPLEDILADDAKLRKLLEDIDSERVTLWLFTNAYKTHGLRVVRLLGVDKLFSGITFCDYSSNPMLCKPEPAMFMKAMEESGATDATKCYFVGENLSRLPFLTMIDLHC